MAQPEEGTLSLEEVMADPKKEPPSCLHFFYREEDYYLCGKPRKPGNGEDGWIERADSCPECVRISRLIARHKGR